MLKNYERLIKENDQLFGDIDDITPFIYINKGNLVYIRKYYKLEQLLLKSLTRFSHRTKEVALKNEMDLIHLIIKDLDKISSFPLSDKTAETTVKLLRKNLVILSGGPGTGKTTTVTAILRIIKILEKKNNISVFKRIKLAAPTGRAANRMVESIRGETKKNPIEGIDSSLPDKASTLHKLLGINPARKDVLYNRTRFIPADLIVLDEASMVDARMMSLLFEALSPECTLLLVGDKDQLPSVEAGAIFGDIVTGAESEKHKLADSVVFLKKSWRSASSILKVAKEVIKGKGDEALSLLKEDSSQIIYNEIPNIEKLIGLIVKKYNLQAFAGSYKKFPQLRSSNNPNHKFLDDQFQRFENFAVLIPSRKGTYGVENINNQINFAITGREKSIYHGQPIMIRTNDYNLSLFNGDRGIIFNFGGEFYAVFREGTDKYRYIHAGKLSSFDTAYVQTIHKSQGSEFGEVMIIVPDGAERLLTREIIYTGLTRAKEKVTLLSSDQIFCKAVLRDVERHSGIKTFLLSR